MTENYLYRRITEKLPTTQGTLSEPDGAPTSRFAVASSVNWIRALSLIVWEENVTWEGALEKYKSVSRARSSSDRATNTIYEQLLLSLHHLSALHAMSEAGKAADLNRIAIMDWYYGIYCAASAMVAAKDGSQQQDHAGTAKQWDQHIAAAGLAFQPFNYRISTLVKSAADKEIAALSEFKKFELLVAPANRQEAEGACLTYLSGTRNYREWQIKNELLSRELKAKELDNFKTKFARKIRDERLHSKSLGFVLQAFRFRGKANYRDALYLTHDFCSTVGSDLFIEDMEEVLKAYLRMAGAYCSRRMSKDEWMNFISDLTAHLKLSVMPKDVWL